VKADPASLPLSVLVPLSFSLPFFVLGFVLTVVGFVVLLWISLFVVVNAYWLSLTTLFQFMYVSNMDTFQSTFDM